MAAVRVERGDLWKSKALSVQLRLRQRFRVEVDRRLRHHPIFSNDGYFSSTFQRWLQRFRDFRRDSLPSSTTFYLKRAFFRSVKVLPVSRGDGIYQKGMDLATSKLNQGGWVHIFPEGSRSRDGGKTMGSSKRGVGRLVLDTDNIPMVVPFVHSGMQDIMPIGASIPRIGNTVTVVIGDPIYFDDLLNSEGAKHVSRGKLYDAVSSRIGHRLRELKVQVDKLAQVTQPQNLPAQDTDRATVILQQVDWESFGMGNLTYSEDDGSTVQETEIQPAAPPCTEEPRSADWSYRVGFSREGGIASRMRCFMDQSEFMGFAARGIFMNRRAEEPSPSGRGVVPLKAWRRYLEANVLLQWN